MKKTNAEQFAEAINTRLVTYLDGEIVENAMHSNAEEGYVILRDGTRLEGEVLILPKAQN